MSANVWTRADTMRAAGEHAALLRDCQGKGRDARCGVGALAVVIDRITRAQLDLANVAQACRMMGQEGKADQLASLAIIVSGIRFELMDVQDEQVQGDGSAHLNGPVALRPTKAFKVTGAPSQQPSLPQDTPPPEPTASLQSRIGGTEDGATACEANAS